jgi:glycosyltransferase involved in cell wall biosynthesis
MFGLALPFKQHDANKDRDMPENRPKILLVCRHSPFLGNNGGQQRTRLMFEYLRSVGHVDLVCMTKDPKPESFQGPDYTVWYFDKVIYKARNLLQFLAWRVKVWDPYTVHPKNDTCHQIVDQLIERYNYRYIVFRYLDAVFLCGQYRRRGLIIDVDDLPEQHFYTLFRDPGLKWRSRALQYFNFLLSRFYCRRLIRKSRHAFFSNPRQAVYPNASCLPNIPLLETELKEPLPLKEGCQTVLFVGLLTYPPNMMGVDAFLNQIWDKVKMAVPDAKLRIAGKYEPSDVIGRWKGKPGVEVAGFVEDLMQEYGNSALVIAPIFHGSGTNIKVLEAMAVGRTCVISDFAARGLERMLSNNENVVVASDSDEYAAAVAGLLRDPVRNDRIRRNAFDTVNSLATKDHFRESISSVIN